MKEYSVRARLSIVYVCCVCVSVRASCVCAGCEAERCAVHNEDSVTDMTLNAIGRWYRRRVINEVHPPPLARANSQRGERVRC